MAHVWRGVMNEYADRLGVTAESTVVSLGEGGTPLVPAPALSKRTGAQVWVKFEGMNPTGSFKDRGMTVALSRAVEHGAKAVICADPRSPRVHERLLAGACAGGAVRCHGC